MTSNMGSVVFNHDDWRKLEEYTSLCPVEIACMGYAALEDGDVMVKDVFLVPQVISLSAVEFVEKGLPYAVQKAIEEERVEELRFCWHSHATHGAYFSTTDEEMVNKVRKAGPIPWFASAILNKKGDTHAQLDYFKPEGDLAMFANHITIKLDVAVEGKPIDNTQIRLAEIEMFAEQKKAKPAGKKASSNTDNVPLERPHKDDPPPKVGPRDWKLHAEAKKNGYDCYVDEESLLAYYWNSETGEYLGSALIPTDKEGNWRVDINVTVIDGDSSEDDPGTELVPLSDAEEEMLNAAVERGML